MGVSVKVEGLAALEAELEKLTTAAGKGALRRAARKSAEPLADLMRQGAPRDEGDLEASIGVSTKLSPRQRKLHRKTVGDGKAAVEIFIGAGPLPQAHLKEFGTFAMAPEPFARPAWDQDRKALLDRLRAALWDEVQKSVARAERKAAKAAQG
ncbi:HK97-gp10 family putative phage morphogenesis protein [Sulfitobacter sp. TB366]|uniref:HK97-gp10 family putative phage morphogenesis protein n=1 Tax=Sulfitobacter sp. TB366 TaxID=3368580 RepID=UPI003746DE2B